MYTFKNKTVLVTVIICFVLLTTHGTSGLKCHYQDKEIVCNSGEEGCFRAICGSPSAEVTGCYTGNICNSNMIDTICGTSYGDYMSECWTCQEDMCNAGEKPKVE